MVVIFLPDERPRHFPLQAGVGKAAGGRTGQTQTRFGVPNRRIFRTTPRSPPTHHELCVHEDVTRNGRRRLSPTAPLGGHSQQHTKYRSRKCQYACGWWRTGQTRGGR